MAPRCTEHRACSKSVSDGLVRDIHTSWSHSVSDPDTGPADGAKAFDRPFQLSYRVTRFFLKTLFMDVFLYFSSKKKTYSEQTSSAREN